MATTVFTPSAGVLNGNDTNPNTSFRVRCVLTAASSGKLQVTFTASTATGLTASNASIGKWDGTNNPFTTTTPVELKFGGASGFSIGAGGSITSDLTDHSAAFSLSLGESVLVDLDCTSPSGQRYRGSNSNVDTWYALGATSYNLPTPAGYSKLAGVDYAVEKVETDSASGVNGSLTATIATVGQSASGKLIVQGSVSQTIAAFTQIATGKVIKSGSFAQAIDPVTQTASGKLVVSGSLSGTIGDFTLSASGGVAASGSVNATIDPVTQSAVGALVIQGSFDQTIGAVTQSATGAVIIKGSFGQTIDPVTLVAAGSSAELPEIEGQFDQTIGPILLSAVGQGPRSDDADTHDGRVWDFSQSERDEQERTKARRASEKQLRRAIERAVNIVRASDEVPSQVAPVEASRPQVAELVMMDINTNGLSASLESIERLLAQYEAQIADEELENEALALLLVAA